VRRVGVLIGLWACILLTGCSANDPTPTADQANLRGSDPTLSGLGPGVELRLSTSGDQRRDQIVVTATVTNKSRQLVAWDSEFSVHVHLGVRGDKSDGVEWERLTMAARPTPAESRDRFVLLQPGQSVSKEIDLSNPLRAGIEGHGTYPKGGHKGIFYEELGRYYISDDCKQITVSLGYSVHHLAFGGLIDWFGDGLRELPFWDGRAESTPLTVRLK
jgi:hypothetical protein